MTKAEKPDPVQKTVDISGSPEALKNTGRLVVLTGLAGVGKDRVFDELVTLFPDFQRVVSFADRAPREGEINGVHHHFVTPQFLDEQNEMGMLVEEPIYTGPSRKATPKAEFKKILHQGHSLIWRIEPTMAVKVATGELFESQFSPDESFVLQKSSTVIFLTAPQHELIKRRQLRDGEKHNPNNYTERDRIDSETFLNYRHVFKHVVENKDGKLEETITKITQILQLKKS